MELFKFVEILTYISPFFFHILLHSHLSARFKEKFTGSEIQLSIHS